MGWRINAYAIFAEGKFEKEALNCFLSFKRCYPRKLIQVSALPTPAVLVQISSLLRAGMVIGLIELFWSSFLPRWQIPVSDWLAAKPVLALACLIYYHSEALKSKQANHEKHSKVRTEGLLILVFSLKLRALRGRKFRLGCVPKPLS
ncbi:hypothetical protein WAE56_08190 [Iodobacter sp. LRB]|uniref:hypothetical protein n=1 Tax=unclassified Iodobacter TaxID=235634 RepID=UPI001179B164|nr:hypothetical protein [Iodobacter sp. BJB302]